MSDVEAVLLIVKNDKDEFLAVGQRDNPMDWGFPGGKVDASDRTPLNALSREIMEETGLIIVNPKLQKAVPHGGYLVAIYTAAMVLPHTEPRAGEPPFAWVSRQTIIEGPTYGAWNKQVLEDLGI